MFVSAHYIIMIIIIIIMECCRLMLDILDSVAIIMFDVKPKGLQGYGLSIVRFRYLVPRIFVCVVFSCLAILRIEGCLNRTL